MPSKKVTEPTLCSESESKSEIGREGQSPWTALLLGPGLAAVLFKNCTAARHRQQLLFTDCTPARRHRQQLPFTEGAICTYHHAECLTPQNAEPKAENRGLSFLGSKLNILSPSLHGRKSHSFGGTTERQELPAFQRKTLCGLVRLMPETLQLSYKVPRGEGD